MKTMHRLKLIRDVDDLVANRDQWESLPNDNPFLSADWMFPWIAAMGPERQIAVLVQLDRDGNWKGIAPFCLETTKTMNRKLQFLSSDTACADYLDLICDDENYDDFASDVAGWLVENIDRKGEWSGFDSFELKGIAANGRANQRLVPVLVEHGFQRFETDLENCWAVELPSTWEELNSRFSKKHRRKTKKAIKHLADPQTTIHSTDTQDFDSLWESFVNLHQKRRVSIGQAGCFASSGFHKFLKSTAAAMVASGSAQMVEIRTGGVAFASMLLLKNDKQSFMYQTGMDPQYSKLEPGYQLITYALQSAILDQHDTFDFLRGDEPYKARWNTEAIPLVRSRLIPPKFSASLRHQIWLSSRAIKQYATNIGLLR